MKIQEVMIELEKAWDEAIDQETGEILSEEAFKRIEALELALDEKIENLGCLYKNTVAYGEAIKAEKMKLAKRQAAAEKRAESIKEYLAMITNGQKFKSAKVEISFRRSEAVEVDEGVLLPDEYLTFKAPTPNKTALKQALKKGAVIEGARLVENNNIQVK